MARFGAFLDHILFPAHPRTAKRVQEFGFKGRLAAIWFAVFGAHVLIVAAAPMDFGTRKAGATASRPAPSATLTIV